MADLLFAAGCGAFVLPGFAVNRVENTSGRARDVVAAGPVCHAGDGEAPVRAAKSDYQFGGAVDAAKALDDPGVVFAKIANVWDDAAVAYAKLACGGQLPELSRNRNPGIFLARNAWM